MGTPGGYAHLASPCPNTKPGEAQFGAESAAGLATKKSGREPELVEAELRNMELKQPNAEIERKLHVANVAVRCRWRPLTGRSYSRGLTKYPRLRASRLFQMGCERKTKP